MSTNGLVSIIIGSYNGEDFLSETIDSILGQTYKNLELIFVDDGSTDGTLKIIHEYAQKDSRVCILSQKNQGLSAAREAGYHIAKGEYIILADDDDVWSPYMIEDLVYLAEKYTDAGAVVTYNKQMSNLAEISNYSWNSNLKNDTVGNIKVISGHKFALLYEPKDKIRLSVSWGILFKRKLIDKIAIEILKVKEKLPTHYFNESYFSCLIYGMSDKIVITNQVHILYRISKSSLCHKSTVSLHVKHYIYAAEETLKYYKSIGWNDVYEKVLPGCYLILLRTWFMIYEHEKNAAERNFYFSDIQRLYKQRIVDLKRVNYKGIKAKIIYWTILFWNYCPRLWFWIVKIICRW